MTRYPCDLPAYDQASPWWNVTGSLARGGDIDEGTAWSEYEIDASSADEAERRLFAYIDRNFEDDLRGATATGTQVGPGRFRVRLALARPR